MQWTESGDAIEKGAGATGPASAVRVYDDSRIDNGTAAMPTEVSARRGQTAISPSSPRETNVGPSLRARRCSNTRDR